MNNKNFDDQENVVFSFLKHPLKYSLVYSLHEKQMISINGTLLCNTMSGSKSSNTTFRRPQKYVKSSHVFSFGGEGTISLTGSASFSNG